MKFKPPLGPLRDPRLSRGRRCDKERGRSKKKQAKGLKFINALRFSKFIMFSDFYASLNESQLKGSQILACYATMSFSILYYLLLGKDLRMANYSYFYGFLYYFFFNLKITLYFMLRDGEGTTFKQNPSLW